MIQTNQPFLLIQVNQCDAPTRRCDSDECLAERTARDGRDVPRRRFVHGDRLEWRRGPGGVVDRELLPDPEQKPRACVWVERRGADVLPRKWQSPQDSVGPEGQVVDVCCIGRGRRKESRVVGEREGRDG